MQKLFRLFGETSKKGELYFEVSISPYTKILAFPGEKDGKKWIDVCAAEKTKKEEE